MDFELSPRVKELRERIDAFVDAHVTPREQEALEGLDAEVATDVPFPRAIEEMRERARAEGLWNLFMADPFSADDDEGLTNWEYGVLCERMGRSPIAPMAFNCAAPDTGNMEILAEHGTEEQRERFLRPLVEGETRSCFSMTEPETSGSDPTGLQATATLEDGEWVVEGHKWYSTGALGASVSIVMVVTDPDAAPHERASMIVVPLDTPGVELVRPIPVMGHSGGPGHWDIRFDGARVPESHLLGERGKGFVIAQDRLGPGRIHHCMRAIGSAERALEMMCARASEREAFGGPLAEKQFVQDFIARSRIEVDGARLMVLHAAWKMDTEGKRAARQEIAMIKVVAANVQQRVLDRAIQVHGGLGMSDDTPLALMWREGRALRLVDGADEVHKMSIALREIKRQAQTREAAGQGAPAGAAA